MKFIKRLFGIKKSIIVKYDEKMNLSYKVSLFKVTGAGQILISNQCHFYCHGKTGFDFSVEWGKYGYSGGVLPKDEAKKLAEHILNSLDQK
jgi:hypothetical protein